MKKLLFILCAAIAVLFTGCDAKQEVTAHIDFVITADCRTQEDLTKIENLMRSKGLPVAANVPLTVEGSSEKDIEIRVKQIVADFLFKVSAAEINALQTGATVVYYKASYVGLSSAIAISQKTL